MKFSIANARQAAAVGNYGEAVLNYLTVLRIIPADKRQSYVLEFCKALENLIDDDSDFCRDKGSVFALSREVFPTDPNVLALSVQFLYFSGNLLEALQIARDSYPYCKNDGDYVRAMVNAENIKSNVFDQWHWAMLNDYKRNFLYAEAIASALRNRPESRVLDIGGGTALLSLYASRYSDHIYCCEVSNNMCFLAKKILEGNDKIRLIEGHSTQLNLDKLDFQMVDVVVTETMDSGLFGEKIASSLLDAHRRLAKPNSLFIPYKATVFGALVDCNHISNEHVAVIREWRFISRFVKSGCIHPKEPYWCCYIDEVKGGYAMLTEPFKLLEVLFNNATCLQEFCDGISTTLTAQITRRGNAHAIMAWFQCQLFPGMELLSNDHSASSCWQQAIFPLPLPYAVKVGDKCVISVSVCKDRMSCELLNMSATRPFQLADQNIPVGLRDDTSKEVQTLDARMNDLLNEVNIFKLEMASSNDDRNIEAGTSVVTPPVVLENTDFLYLNDHYLEDFFSNCLLDIFQLSHKIVDLTNLASVSLKLERSFRFYYAACFYQNLDYKIIMDKCCDTSKSNVLPIDGPEFPCQANIILFWPLGSSGCLCETSLDQLVDMKIINPIAVVIPAVITITGCVVSCEHVAERSRLKPDAYIGADLSAAQSLAISYYYDIELSTLQYQKLSEACELLTLHFDNEFALDSSDLPLCLQQLRRLTEMDVIHEGVADGILFWFDASFSSHHYSSASVNTNARCAMFVFGGSRKVSVGDKLSLRTSLYHGNIVIEETG